MFLFRLVHLELVKLCRLAGDTYGLHILVSIVLAFGMMVSNIYSMYNVLTSSDDKSKEWITKSMITCSNWLAYNMYKIVLLSWFCDSVCQEVSVFVLDKFFI